MNLGRVIAEIQTTGTVTGRVGQLLGQLDALATSKGLRLPGEINDVVRSLDIRIGVNNIEQVYAAYKSMQANTQTPQRQRSRQTK